MARFSVCFVGIRVSLLGNGKVALDAKVHDWHERDAVSLAAWSALGVMSVEDCLTTA